MAHHPRGVDEAIARFDELAHRLDGRAPVAAPSTVRRADYGRRARIGAKRLANMGVGVAAVIALTIAFGLFVGPIGLAGLFVVALATMCLLVFLSSWPAAPRRVDYRDDLPTRAVTQGLGDYLARERRALPAPAAREVDAIAAQLPLLEQRLAELDPLDPLAQDARRLMGKHLPELIERYERVPAGYRAERDGEGLTVDQRLTAGLGAARGALGEIADKLVEKDRAALETQGRFIESRYRDGGAG